MFSGLAKLADKGFLIGYFLPALIGLAAFILANQDWPLFARWLCSAQLGEKGLGDIVAVLFVIWTLAVALMGMNDVFIRFLEGYYWPFTQNAFVERQRARFRRLDTQYREEVENLEAAEELLARARRLNALQDSPVSQKLSAFARRFRINKNKMQAELVRQYVTNERLILGTRLGNTLRAFEQYPEQVYGVASIVTWSRLLDAMSKEFRGLLDEARASFDMCAGFIFVSSVVFLVAMCRLVIHVYMDEWALVGRFALTALGALASARMFYSLAIHNAAIWWGEVFKGAHDLYLRTLAEKMGYEAPVAPAKRREFWMKVGWQFRYHEEIDLTDFAIKTAVDADTTNEEEPEEPEKDEKPKATDATKEDSKGASGGNDAK